MSNNKYIFATDVDGTLLMDDKQIHPHTLNAFKLAQEKGHVNVIATGRCVVRTKPLLKKIPYIDYFVCNNGAVVYDVKNDKYIHISGVNPHHYIKIVDFAKKHKITFKLHTDRDWIGDIGIEDQEPTILTNEMDQKIREHIIQYPNDPKLYNLQTPTQMSINASEEFCKKYINDFKKWFEQDSSVYLTNSVYIDVNPKDKSKWTGLIELANHLNINEHKIVTFGDSGNDLEMLIGAKENGYALSNSKPELSQLVKPKIGSNNTGAIGDVILKYIEI